MSRSLLIERIDDDSVQTLGRMTVLDENNYSDFACNTLELPWRDNRVRISCIPKGEYQVLKRWSPKFMNHFHISDVDGRTFILIHPGNYHTQILGCILVGDDFREMNGDGELDVTNSVATLKKLYELMPQKFKLKIVSV